MNNQKDTLYDSFLSYSYNDLRKLFENAKTKEERDFYVTLSDLVLRQKQEKVIGE